MTPEELAAEVRKLNSVSHIHLIGECIGVAADYRTATMQLLPTYSQGSDMVLDNCVIMEERWGWAHVTHNSVSVRQALTGVDGSPILDDSGNQVYDRTRPGELGLITAIGGVEGFKVVQFGLKLGPNWLNSHLDTFSPTSLANPKIPVHARLVKDHELANTLSYSGIMTGASGQGVRMHVRHRPDYLMQGSSASTLGDGASQSAAGKTPSEYVETPIPILNRDDLTSHESYDQIRSQRLMTNWSGTLLQSVRVTELNATGTQLKQEALENTGDSREFDPYVFEYEARLLDDTELVQLRLVPAYPDEVARITARAVPLETGHDDVELMIDESNDTSRVRLQAYPQAVIVDVYVARVLPTRYVFGLKAGAAV